MANLVATLLLTLAQRIKRGGVIINEHTLSKAQTAFHVQVLRRWFDLIRLEDLPGRLLRRTRRPFCLLTFDDGKRSNYTEVAPELERLGAPAVFYVPTEALTTGACLWFDRRNQLVNAIGHCPAGLELDTLKRLPFSRLTERLEKACQEHHFKAREDSPDVRPMSWQEARSLCERGFNIGAHGITHAALTREPRRRAFSEVEASIATVTQELGVRCDTFAFPNGSYTTELAGHARQCGATSVMTTDPWWADQHALMWRLPRVQLFEGFTRARIELKIALAACKGALVNPNGSGRRYRAYHQGGCSRCVSPLD